jgi:ribosomal-protein-alanine N-acetyltransferase
MNATCEDPIYVRWLIRRDMPEVLAIENELPNPATEKEIIDCIRQRTMIGMVVEYEGVVVGYMIYELLKEKLRIHQLAVAKSHRRKGCGTALVQKIIRKLGDKNRTSLGDKNRTSIDIQVSDGNFELIGFLKSLGFFITSMAGRMFWMQFTNEKRLKVSLKNRIKEIQQ